MLTQFRISQNVAEADRQGLVRRFTGRKEGYEV